MLTVLWRACCPNTRLRAYRAVAGLLPNVRLCAGCAAAGSLPNARLRACCAAGGLLLNENFSLNFIFYFFKYIFN